MTTKPEPIEQTNAGDASSGISPLKPNGIVLNATAIAVIVILAFGSWIRLQDLGSPAYHHDESIHAYYSWKLYFHGPYSKDVRGTPAYYDPVYHGPFLYHIGAMSFMLFGDSDFTGRLPFALSGIFLLLVVWELRKIVGKRAALLILLLAALSPSLSYFARFARNDTYVGAQCLAMVYCALRYFNAGEDKGRFRWLYGMVLFLALHYATKENSYAHGAIYCSFLGFFAWYYLLTGKIKGSDECKRRMQVVFVRHNIFVKLYALYGWFSAFMFFYVWLNLFKSDKILTSWSPTAKWAVYWFLAALVLVAVLFVIWILRRKALSDDTEKKSEEETHGGIALSLIRNYPLFISLAILFFVYAFFFTTMFANPDGLRDGVYDYLAHWQTIHDTPRIPGPWWYYLPRLALYETLGLLTWFIALGTYPLWLLRDMSKKTERPPLYWPLRFFLIYYSFVSIAIYCELQEKVPWLLVHQALPLTFLAGLFFADVWERIGSKAVRTIAFTFFTILALWALKGNILVNCYYNDDPRELMVYTQTDPVVRKILKEVDEVCYLSGQGPKTRLVVSGEAQWPFSWYLRNHKNWTIGIDKRAAMLIVDDKMDTAMRVKLGGRYTVRTYDFRSHWSPDLNRLKHDKDQFSKRLWRYALYREIWSDAGSPKIKVYVRKDLVKDIEPLDVDLPQGSGNNPMPGQFVRSIGSRGSGELQLNQPRGLAMGPDGSLYIADSKNGRIQKFASDGRFQMTLGQPGQNPGEFNAEWSGPGGVAVGPDGSIYVADTWNHRVQKFSANGRFVGEWGGAIEPFFGPRAIATDTQGNVYVVDTGKKRIQKFDANGKFLRQWGREGVSKGEFDEPVGIAVDQQNQVYIADTGNKRVQVFDANGRFLRQIYLIAWETEDTVGIEPYIAVDDQGRIFVSDSNAGMIVQISADGKRVIPWGVKGTSAGMLSQPTGLAITPDGNIWVADKQQNRISLFRAR